MAALGALGARGGEGAGSSGCEGAAAALRLPFPLVPGPLAAAVAVAVAAADAAVDAASPLAPLVLPVLALRRWPVTHCVVHGPSWKSGRPQPTVPHCREGFPGLRSGLFGDAPRPSDVAGPAVRDASRSPAVASMPSKRAMSMLARPSPPLHVHRDAVRPSGSQECRAKLVDSAQLSPQLNPKWYARGKVMTKSPGTWRRWHSGTPLFTSTSGAISVVLWRRKLRHEACVSGRL